jgi:3-oxoacyl-[acyl-carrier-protein] synthase II
MKRVVITEMGALTPIRNNVKKFWENLVAGKSGAERTKFNPAAFMTQIAWELKNFDASQFLDRGTLKRTAPCIQYALIAATQAIENSGFNISLMDPYSIGVIWGNWTRWDAYF